MKKKRLNTFYSINGLLFSAILFLTLSFIFNTLYTDHTSVKRESILLEKYIKNYQQRFDKLLADTQLLRKFALGSYSQTEIKSLVNEPFGFYLYQIKPSGLIETKLWNNQYVVPTELDFNKTQTENFITLANGTYVQVNKKIVVSGVTGYLAGCLLIPVSSNYFIETDYLPQSFYYSEDAGKRIAISETPTDFPINSLTGNTLFYLIQKASGAVAYNNWFTLVLRFTGLFFLLLFFHFLSEKIAAKHGVWKGIATLSFLVILLRLLLYLEPDIFNFRQFELFNPRIYGSSGLQRSLGDLLLNSLLLCWILVFAWSKTKNVEPLITIKSDFQKRLFAFFALLILILSTFFLASVIKSMVADSKISFDVTNFFSLDIYSVIGLIVLASLSLAYYYFTQILFRILFQAFSSQVLVTYFAIAVTGLIYLTLKFGKASVLFYLPVLGWLLIYAFIVQKQREFLTRFKINIAGILFWIFIFTFSVSLIILSENKKVEWERRKIYAERLATQTDPSSERILNIALLYFDDEFLTGNFYRFINEEKGKKIRDSILNENYRGYLNKYDTKLYLFDEKGKPLFNNDALDFETLNNIFTQQAQVTKNTDLKYYEISYDRFKYITKKNIKDESGKYLGSLFIISDPKKYSSDALFPELFKQYRKTDPESSPIYSSGIYSAKKLISSSNNYQFATSLSDKGLPEAEYEKKRNGDFDELWYRAGNEKVVVMARKRQTWIEAISLFSYLFCAFLFLVLIVQLISFILITKLQWQKIKDNLQLNIGSQIHTTVIFVSLLSFIIIGIATISFFKERYLRNNNDKLSRTMRIMVNEMQKKQSDQAVFDDVIKIYDSVSLHKLQTLIDEVSDIHDIDVNVYDLEGNLQVSSEATVYTKGVLSKKMHPLAFFELNKMRLVHFVQEEKIGKLTYLSIYAPVRDEQKNVYAYLNIPYFALQRELNQDISNFLVTIINLNAFIFLIAGIIALFVTNRITNSFSVISDKMKEISLAGKNEEIVWKRRDEIGELVKEYNKMVAKLGESAIALAKSEREGAWREMARQVAHEIKNPLTPMKLSIQYLQKAIDSNQPNVKELSSSVASTLVEQIDHLTKIASDFSQFANIGITSTEIFDLHEVIASLKDLYQSSPGVDFKWNPVNGKLLLNADRTQMNRLFTNLFANALEACNGNSDCRITVNEEKENGKIRIRVTDNGEGIPEEMQLKIFIPNFTTKTSGTGLGLAMCKGIAEQAKGNIWFETEYKKGTTFIVELPIIN